MKQLVFRYVVPLLLVSQCSLASQHWFLERQNYFEPIAAEPRAARINLTVPILASAVPYAQKPGKFWGWDVALGAEIPMFGFDSRTDRRRDLQAGEQGFAFLTPVSFHMMEDLGEKSAPSAPILNTDYRFGSMVKYGRGLSENWRMAVRVVPIAHESTHLGDEFILAARRNPNFKRVNVSYEYWETAGALTGDRCFGLGVLIRLGSLPDEVQCRTTVKAGYLRPWGYSNGYYSEDLLAPEGATILPSINNGEWHFGFETMPVPTQSKLYRPFVSVDGRFKPVYDYEKTNPSQKEKVQLSWNVLVGFARRGPQITNDVPFNIFLRFYHGVNPHGQFRNQPNFTLIGFGIYVPIL